MLGGVVKRQESSAEDPERYFMSGEGLRGVQAHPHQHETTEGASTSVREFEYRGHQASAAGTLPTTRHDSDAGVWVVDTSPATPPAHPGQPLRARSGLS